MSKRGSIRGACVLVVVLGGLTAVAPAPAVVTVTAKVETRPVPHAGDAADDVAIWVKKGRRARSTVIGTDKLGGIAVYDLRGRLLQYRADGRLNNVDLRRGFRLGSRRVTVVTASNRTDNTIAVYRVVRTRKLANVAAGRLRAGMDVYGLCMYRSPSSDRFYVIVTSKSGLVRQWRLVARRSRVGLRLVRSFDVGSQAEGCVADDKLGRLYVGEENQGIWRYRARPRGGTRRVLIDRTGHGGHLVADVEGLAIARHGRRGFLVASSQGNGTFVVYRRRSNAYVKTFRIGAGNRVDAVSDTDGIDVTATTLGRRFRGGLFVAQDGNNRPGHQNFKLVSWRSILRR